MTGAAATPGRVCLMEAVRIVAMQRRLHVAGFVLTAAALNVASNKLGWEAARLADAKKGAPNVDV